MRRRPVVERVEDGPELLVHRLQRVALELEAALQQLPPVDPDGAAAELPAVERQVVLERPGTAGGVVRRRPVRVAGRGDQQGLVLGQDPGERVVGGVPATDLRVPLVHREAMDPDVGEDVRVGQPQPVPELDPKPAEDVGGHVGAVRHDEDQVALGSGRLLDDRPLEVVRQELGDRAADVATRLEREVGQALRPEPARALGQLVDLTPGHAGHAGRHDRLDPAARREGRVEHAEARRRGAVRRDEDAAEVDQLHAEADVRLVRAEPLEGFLVGHPRERHLEERPVGHGGARDLDGHLLDEGHHGVLVDEAHLEVELGELGLAVAAQVLVAVAPGDLHVAVDAGDHQQLLELLRALRQGVHGPGLEPARDDEVARAFGRALDQRGRLDLDEAVGVMDLADGLDHPAPEHQPALHRLAPDVEVAVLQAQGLVDRRVRLVDVEGRRLRLGQDVHLGRLELDRTCRQLRVLRAGQPHRHRAGHGHHELRADPAGRLVGDRGVHLVDDDLRDAVPIAQVQEDELAVVAPPMDPAGQAGARPCVGGAELPARVRAIGRGEAGALR